MTKKEFTVSFISWFLKAIIFVIFVMALIYQNIIVAMAAFLALIFSILPVLIARNYKKHLPLAVDLPVTLALLLHTIGLAFDLYHQDVWWWWDIMTHFLGTVAVATLAFLMVYSMREVKIVSMGPIMMAVAVFSVALAIGALWEVGEFYFDKIFNTRSLGDIVDTIQDLQFDALGGLLVAGIGAKYVNWREHK